MSILLFSETGIMHSKKSHLVLYNRLSSGINLQWTSMNYVGFAMLNRILNNIDPGSLIHELRSLLSGCRRRYSRSMASKVHHLKS